MAVLRPILLTIGVLMLLTAFLAMLLGAALSLVLWLSTMGLMLVVGLLIERGRYKPPEPGHPGPGWVATGERFVDPETGEPVTVYYQPASGERRYVSR